MPTGDDDIEEIGINILPCPTIKRGSPIVILHPEDLDSFLHLLEVHREKCERGKCREAQDEMPTGAITLEDIDET